MSFEEAYRYLESARRSTLCAVHILMNVDDAEGEIGQQVLSAWDSIAAIQAVEAERALPNLEALPGVIDTSNLRFLRRLTVDEWKEDLEKFQADQKLRSWDPEFGSQVSLLRLREHCDLLEHTLAMIESALRKKYGRTIWKARWFRVLSGSVAVVAVVGALSFFVRDLLRDPPPWSGKFYDNVTLNGAPKRQEQHRELVFDWDVAPPFAGFPADSYSASFDSCLVVEEGGKASLVVGSDDGSRVYVDNQLMIDHWGPHPYSEKQKEHFFEPGVYALRVEYSELGGGARLEFHLKPSADSQMVLRPMRGDKGCAGYR